MHDSFDSPPVPHVDVFAEEWEGDEDPSRESEVESSQNQEAEAREN